MVALGQLMSDRQLECRIVIIHKRPRMDEIGAARKFELGMYDPANRRYERLGEHPESRIDKVVADLKVSIERAGHLLTFCERSE